METFRGEELRQIQLFQSVDLDAIKGILDACTVRSLGEGEVLIAAGQDNRTVYFLLEGHVRIHLVSPEDRPAAILGCP
jgi:CRP-like cAMP-binding protein